MAKIIDGKAAAFHLRESVKRELETIRKSLNESKFTPQLAIIQVGNRADSNVYIRNKLRAAEDVDIRTLYLQMSKETTQEILQEKIESLNSDESIDGIIVQLPLDSLEYIDAELIVNKIQPDKDVDGLTRENAGRLIHGEIYGTVIPCTPRGCLYLVQSTGVEIKGKRVVVMGRSKIVGAPTAALFMWHDATVTVCHSRTLNIEEICKQADILIVAVGVAKLVKAEWVKPGAVVIDCGINVVEAQGQNGKNKLVGDVDFEAVRQVAGYITPVPGGVGPMTVAMLIRNTLDQAKYRHLGEVTERERRSSVK